MTILNAAVRFGWRRLVHQSWMHLLVLLSISVCLGLSLSAVRSPAIAQTIPTVTPSTNPSSEIMPSAAGTLPDLPDIGTVDPVPLDYHLGQERYLAACGSCHVALPPAVMPGETWRQLLMDPQHYGVELPTLLLTQQLPMWEYLRDFSRPLDVDESVPYRLNTSRYFAALHPEVNFAAPVTVESCVTCHPSAPVFNYRQLSAEWQE